jgi:hypothetical protein
MSIEEQETTLEIDIKKHPHILERRSHYISSHRIRDNVRTWLDNNCAGWKLDMHNRRYSPYTLIFQNNEYAILFKLVWL